jgi:HEAT repeat protein
VSTIDEIVGRCEALRSVGPRADPADVAWLIGCFDHPLKVVQRTAGETLVALADAGTPVSQAVEDAMEVGPFRRRWVAAWAASRMGGPWSAVRLAVLLEALGSDDGDVRWAAARILTGAAAVPDALVPRLRDLTGSGGPEQRKMAVYCLRDLGCTDVASAACYRAALGDGSPGVRLAGMSALLRTHGESREDARRIARLLGDPDGGVRRAAAATLGRMSVADAEVVEALERAAGSDDPVFGRAARAALAALR